MVVVSSLDFPPVCAIWFRLSKPSSEDKEGDGDDTRPCTVECALEVIWFETKWKQGRVENE